MENEKNAFPAGSETVNCNSPNSVELRLFFHQVTGHNILLKYDRYTLCKQWWDREVRFYYALSTFPNLIPLVPTFKGVVTVTWLEDENCVAHLIAKPVADQGIPQPPLVLNTPVAVNSDMHFRIVHSSQNDTVRRPYFIYHL